MHQPIGPPSLVPLFLMSLNCSYNATTIGNSLCSQTAVSVFSFGRDKKILIYFKIKLEINIYNINKTLLFGNIVWRVEKMALICVLCGQHKIKVHWRMQLLSIFCHGEEIRGWWSQKRDCMSCCLVSNPIPVTRNDFCIPEWHVFMNPIVYQSWRGVVTGLNIIQQKWPLEYQKFLSNLQFNPLPTSFSPGQWCWKQIREMMPSCLMKGSGRILTSIP